MTEDRSRLLKVYQLRANFDYKPRRLDRSRLISFVAFLFFLLWATVEKTWTKTNSVSESGFINNPRTIAKKSHKPNPSVTSRKPTTHRHRRLPVTTIAAPLTSPHQRMILDYIPPFFFFGKKIIYHLCKVE